MNGMGHWDYHSSWASESLSLILTDPLWPDWNACSARPVEWTSVWMFCSVHCFVISKEFFQLWLLSLFLPLALSVLFLVMGEVFFSVFDFCLLINAKWVCVWKAGDHGQDFVFLCMHSKATVFFFSFSLHFFPTVLCVGGRKKKLAKYFRIFFSPPTLWTKKWKKEKRKKKKFALILVFDKR